MSKKMKEWYGKCIIEKGKETFLYAFIAFGISVGVSRLIALDIEKGKAIFGYLYIKGYHIHHFYYGILLLIISSWMSLIRHRKLHRRLFKGVNSIIFGGGLGLLVDEFGLLLTMEFGLKGNYWAPQSYYAIATAASVFVLFLLLLRAD